MLIKWKLIRILIHLKPLNSNRNKSKEINLKNKYKSLIFVTPGIRLPKNKKNDQKRIESPRFAIKAGSNILVIGRPITKSKDPVNAIQEIVKNIEYGK